jgi:5-methylthioadenosine/S-adenosylhomocysteine deaminase
MAQPADLLIEPRWLLPMAGADAVLEGHAVAVDAGRIIALGPVAELRARFAAREHVQRLQHVLMPGLVNAHTRAHLALLRALVPYGAGQAGGGALQLEHGAGADFVRDGTRLAIAQMLRAGITCFADLSPHPEETARVTAAAQLRALVGLPIGEGSAEHTTTQLARAERLWDEYRADARIGLFFAPYGASAPSDATLARVRRVADELEARLALPLSAAPPGAQEVGVRDGAALPASLVARFAALGLLRPGAAAIALSAVPAEDVQLIARHGAALIVCPQASLRAGAGVPLIEGERTGLGSDSPAGAGSLDLLAEARTAALLGGFSAATALRLATLGGATTLGLQAQIGSLEAGKAADLTCIELDPLAQACCANLADAILFGATRAAVSDVWSGGRRAVRDHRLLAFDLDELTALPARWAARLKMGAAA